MMLLSDGTRNLIRALEPREPGACGSALLPFGEEEGQTRLFTWVAQGRKRGWWVVNLGLPGAPPSGPIARLVTVTHKSTPAEQFSSDHLLTRWALAFDIATPGAEWIVDARHLYHLRDNLAGGLVVKWNQEEEDSPGKSVEPPGVPKVTAASPDTGRRIAYYPLQLVTRKLQNTHGFFPLTMAEDAAFLGVTWTLGALLLWVSESPTSRKVTRTILLGEGCYEISGSIVARCVHLRTLPLGGRTFHVFEYFPTGGEERA